MVGLFFVQLCTVCSSGQDFDRPSASRGPSAVAELLVILQIVQNLCGDRGALCWRLRRSLPLQISHFRHSLFALYPTAAPDVVAAAATTVTS